jgi:hypothetical protein
MPAARRVVQPSGEHAQIAAVRRDGGPPAIMVWLRRSGRSGFGEIRALSDSPANAGLDPGALGEPKALSSEAPGDIVPGAGGARLT